MNIHRPGRVVGPKEPQLVKKGVPGHRCPRVTDQIQEQKMFLE